MSHSNQCSAGAPRLTQTHAQCATPNEAIDLTLVTILGGILGAVLNAVLGGTRGSTMRAALGGTIGQPLIAVFDPSTW